MGIGYIRKSIIKNSLIWILIFGFIGAHIVYWGYIGKAYISSIFIKPIVLTEDKIYPDFFTSTLPPMANVDELDIENTGYYLWEQAENGPEKKTDAIYYTYIEDKFVICVYPSTVAEDPDQLNTENMMAYVASPSSIESYDELLGKLVTDINEAYKEYGIEVTNEDFAPKVLNIESKDELLGRQILLILIGLIGVWSAFGFITNLITLFNYKAAKGIKYLGQYGYIEDIIHEIEHEGPNWRMNEYMFTDKWFISTKLSTSVIKIEDILWVYTKIKGTKRFTIFTLQVHTRDGKKYSIYTMNMNNNDEVKEQINQLVPFILYGDTPENRRLWKKDLRGMIEEVELNKKISTLNQNSSY